MNLRIYELKVFSSHPSDQVVEDCLLGLRSVGSVGKLIQAAFSISLAHPRKHRPYP